MIIFSKIIKQVCVWWKRINLHTTLPSTTTKSNTTVIPPEMVDESRSNLAQTFASQLTWEEEDVIVLKEVPLKPSSS